MATSTARGPTSKPYGPRSGWAATRSIGARWRTTLADLYDDAAVALVWDVRALDAADALGDERAQQHHSSLQVAAFYPSLHLNLADNFRRLGSFDAAADHLARAEDRCTALPDDAYGEMIRSAVADVRRAVVARSTERRGSAPGP